MTRVVRRDLLLIVLIQILYRSAQVQDRPNRGLKTNLSFRKDSDERNSAILKLLETALFAVFSSIGIRLLHLFRYSLL